MSLAAPPAPAPPLLRLRLRRAFPLSAAVLSGALAGRFDPRRRSGGYLGRAYCLFSPGGGRRNQVEARRGPASGPGLNKAGFQQWRMETETWQQKGWRGSPCPAASGGGGRSGGGGSGWFRWFSSGGFWDAAKQTVLTILGNIAAFFLIANFNLLVAAALKPLLLVLRQIRRAITFAVFCVSRGISAPAARPKPTPLPVGSSEPAAAPAKGRVGMSAKERVISKWGSD